uniref:R-spondin 3 n=1 Tax=Canis lupus familiaris TaxID=9615 RepID=A0A8C0PUS9_CANLF
GVGELGARGRGLWTGGGAGPRGVRGALGTWGDAGGSAGDAGGGAGSGGSDSPRGEGGARARRPRTPARGRPRGTPLSARAPPPPPAAPAPRVVPGDAPPQTRDPSGASSRPSAKSQRLYFSSSLFSLLKLKVIEVARGCCCGGFLPRPRAPAPPQPPLPSPPSLPSPPPPSLPPRRPPARLHWSGSCSRTAEAARGLSAAPGPWPRCPRRPLRCDPRAPAAVAAAAAASEPGPAARTRTRRRRAPCYLRPPRRGRSLPGEPAPLAVPTATLAEPPRRRARAAGTSSSGRPRPPRSGGRPARPSEPGARSSAAGSRAPSPSACPGPRRLLLRLTEAGGRDGNRYWVTMHLRLISWFFIILNFMEYIGSQNASRGRRQRRKCKADCDTCFNKNFCTKCKSGFYLHLGKCLDNCPEGLEANNHTMECVSIVHCEASEWSPWSPCMKKGKTCGFKRGTETRVREITQHPSAKGNLCPPTSETRKCTVQRKKCQKGERGKKGRERKRKKPNKEESKDAVPDNKGLEPSRETPEPRENKDKQQQKKRKVQDKQQKSVSVSTGH